MNDEKEETQITSQEALEQKESQPLETEGKLEAERFDEVVEEQAPEVSKGIKIIEDQKKVDEETLKIHEASESDLQDFEEGQDIVGKKLEDKKNEYDEEIERLQKDIPNAEDKTEWIKKRGVSEDENSAKEKAEKSSSSVEIIFFDKDGEETEPKKEYESLIEEAIKLVNKENEYYSKFFDGKNIISGIKFDEKDDNFFAPDDSQNIIVPLKNSENFERTKIIIKHEALHKALRMMVDNKKDWNLMGEDYKFLLIDNIQNGKDCNIKFVGKIKSGQFKEFLSNGEKYSADMSGKTKKEKLGMVFLSKYGESDNEEITGNIEYIIEEILADEALYKREKTEDPNGAAERITVAKITALNDIAKNKGLKNWKELSAAGNKDFFGIYNGCQFLGRINSEGGRGAEAKEFDDFANSTLEQLKNRIKEKYKEDLSKELDDLAEKLQKLIEN